MPACSVYRGYGSSVSTRILLPRDDRRPYPCIAQAVWTCDATEISHMDGHLHASVLGRFRVGGTV